MPNRRVDPLVVVPVDPLGGGQLDVGEASPRSTPLDQLGFLQTDGRFHERVVEGITDGADGGVDAGVDQVGGEAEAGELRPGMRMVNSPDWTVKPSRSRRHNAMSSAFRTNAVRLLVNAAQPTMALENTSTTNMT